jgi:hypothetical protein
MPIVFGMVWKHISTGRFYAARNGKNVDNYLM